MTNAPKKGLVRVTWPIFNFDAHNNIAGGRRWLITITVELTPARLVVWKSVDDTHDTACSLCDRCVLCNDACTKLCM